MFIGNAIGIGNHAGGVTYSAEYQAYLNELTALGYTHPSATVKTAEDNLLQAMIDAFPSRIESINIYLSGSVNNGLVDIYNPSHKHTIIAGGGALIFTEGQGVASDGVSVINQGLKTNRRAGIETNFTTVVYVSEDSAVAVANAAVFGARAHAATATTSLDVVPLNLSTSGNRRGYAAQDSFANTNHRGRYTLTYAGGQSIIYKDGVKDAQTVTPAAPDLANDLLFLGRNGSGVNGGMTASNQYARKTVLIINLLDSITDGEEATIGTIIDAFRAEVGL